MIVGLWAGAVGIVTAKIVDKRRTSNIVVDDSDGQALSLASEN